MSSRTQSIRGPWTVDTSSMHWEPLTSGVKAKRVNPGTSLDGLSTSVLRLEVGASLPAPPEHHGVQVVVLEGELQIEERKLTAGGYARFPAGQWEPMRTSPGCVLFVKSGPFDPGEAGRTVLQSSELPWLPGHGRLEVKPLHEFAGSGCALVRWPAGERFVSHRHWGGEEIFVLSGTFRDEHGVYPAGTWIQSPHLSEHHPFVEEETVIFVRTGHLPIPGAGDPQR